MERLGNTKPAGLHAGMLRVWGILFLAAGVISRGLLQNRLLGLAGLTAQQMLDLIATDSAAMAIATTALVLQAVETCAAPVFAFLLVEGFAHTADFKRYLLRVAGIALLSEIPYNLAVHGSVLHLATRNPVLGLVLGLVALYLWKYFGGSTTSYRLLRAVITVAAVFWAGMLRIDSGIPTVVLVGVLWMLREKPQMRVLSGTVAAMACSAVSPFYLISGMGFLPVHLYNGEPGTGERKLYYFAYPILLVAVWLLGVLVF